MNDIITPVTPDGQVGFDAYGQFNSWEVKENGDKVGTIIADVRGRTCPLCGRGWELTGPGLRNQHYLNVLEMFVHNTCFIGYTTIKEAYMINAALAWAQDKQYQSKAGMLSWKMRQIENEYGGAWNTPWYLLPLQRWPLEAALRQKREHADSTGFAIKFGPRKRVYHLSLHRQGFDFRKYAPFTKDDVTKDFGDGCLLVHAWNDEKVREYLSKMFEIVIANTSEP